jgi:hypothetical protein
MIASSSASPSSCSINNPNMIQILTKNDIPSSTTTSVVVTDALTPPPSSSSSSTSSSSSSKLSFFKFNIPEQLKLVEVLNDDEKKVLIKSTDIILKEFKLDVINGIVNMNDLKNSNNNGIEVRLK